MANGRKGVRPFPKRGSVYVVRFDPTEGSEIKKTRSAMIIQNDIGNRFSNAICGTSCHRWILAIHWRHESFDEHLVAAACERVG